ncbi:hypothetical protein KVR01_006143 [Diaporthe batatas]|uniref:uncharacterized protein n=1 Tax=Diaporthe batatas TaxID=748121 RepID=UPI001D051A87|nr:uncharacterized protein KVR01_006143 [Diaporthe batatas]KAG8164225.1 hypothetical protein KVR01_006143 [Diaporthe batatas]
MAVERFDVVVVGTGWNGLISAKTYLDFKPSAKLVLVDDQASIGGVWNKEKIYPSLYAQIKFGLFEYSFYPMRREGITNDGYISGETINQYLVDFARDYDLTRRVRLNSKVIKVDRVPKSGEWQVDIEGGPSIKCAKLIYASGATSHPVVPSWPQSAEFTTPIIHSSAVGTHLDQLSGIKRAVVVGAAKSAYDTVFLLLSNGVKVDWVIREDGSGPMAIMPPTLFGFLNSMDVISTRVMAAFGASIMKTRGLAYHFLQRTRVGRAVGDLFWRGVTLLADMHAGYSRTPNTENLRPLPRGKGIFWANAGLGCASVPNFWNVVHAGDCKIHRTEIDSLGGTSTVTLRNGERLETDYLILCTGFDKSYHPFSPSLQHQCGLAPGPADADKWAVLEAAAEDTVDMLLPTLRNAPVPKSVHEARREVHETTAGDSQPRKLLHGPSRHYRRLVVPELAAAGDRSVYFPGFIHSIYTPLVSEVQALWGVAFLLDLVDVPSRDLMETEVAEWNVWCRKRYLAQGRKHAYAIFDFLSYIDTLLEDLGINIVRRRNPLTELFMPVYPRNYRGLIDEFRAALARKHGHDRKSGISETTEDLDWEQGWGEAGK